MLINYLIDLSTENKMQRRGLIFLQISKIYTVGKRKKTFSYLISQILIFHIRVFSENAQYFAAAFL